MSDSKSFNFCNRCGSDTWHLIAGHTSNPSAHAENGYTIAFDELSELLQCQVCHQTRLRVTSWNSENEWGKPVYYPLAATHRPPSWLNDLPDEYRDLTKQIYAALDSQSFSLALMGVRALLDIYVSRHSGINNDFQKKLEKLASLGALSAKNIEMLTPTFNAGSAAAHRGFQPSEDQVVTALQVVENLVQQDVLGPKTQALAASVPPRPKGK